MIDLQDEGTMSDREKNSAEKARQILYIAAVGIAGGFGMGCAAVV